MKRGGMDGKWPNIVYGCDRGWNWHVVVYANNELANIILKSWSSKIGHTGSCQRTKRVTIADATRCDMLDIDGMSDAHYNAHVHINKEPCCEQSQY